MLHSTASLSSSSTSHSTNRFPQHRSPPSALSTDPRTPQHSSTDQSLSVSPLLLTVAFSFTIPITLISALSRFSSAHPQVLPSWEATRQGSVSFKMRTTEPDGLLMYNSGSLAAQVRTHLTQHSVRLPFLESLGWKQGIQCYCDSLNAHLALHCVSKGLWPPRQEWHARTLAGRQVTLMLPHCNSMTAKALTTRYLTLKYNVRTPARLLTMRCQHHTSPRYL
ncbi:hypothetical protein E2C01_022223 [Portunus trituberculatus]|uniref:Uncharacterized protein n=1 Tax=Portunus trituberculatus TaxID=210409 RepID=A0A5B7E6P2_PORTR|nr:hypothetical protein [Portunus trituberculatus]